MKKKHLKKLAKKLINTAVPTYLCERFYRNTLVPRLRVYPKAGPKSGTLRNILQVNTALKEGGAAKVSYRLSECLQQRGFNVKNIVKKPMTLKESLVYLSAHKKGWVEFANISSLGIGKMSAFLECDLVHLHNLHGNYFNPFVLPEITAFKPTVWTLHDMQALTGHCAHSFQCHRWQSGCGKCPDLNIYPAISRDETAFLWQTKQKIFELSPLVVVCPSEWLRKKVSQSILQHKEVHLIYNGVDTDIFKSQAQEQARERLKLPKDKKILLFSAAGGSDNPWKGGQYLRSAYEVLKNREDLLFLNIGGGQQQTNNLLNWWDIPYINDEKTMALYYAAADLLAYPSLADNCPLVVLEAMACGLPVVAFKTGGIPELISHGEDGYLAEYKNQQDFVGGLICFLENPELLNKAKHLAPLKISANFSLEKMTNSYINLYEQCYYNQGKTN